MKNLQVSLLYYLRTRLLRHFDCQHEIIINRNSIWEMCEDKEIFYYKKNFINKTNLNAVLQSIVTAINFRII